MRRRGEHHEQPDAGEPLADARSDRTKVSSLQQNQQESDGGDTEHEHRCGHTSHVAAVLGPHELSDRDIDVPVGPPRRDRERCRRGRPDAERDRAENGESTPADVELDQTDQPLQLPIQRTQGTLHRRHGSVRHISHAPIR